MAKYTSVSISGYNSVPPVDDGTVSEANKVKWSTEKTKLTDPLNTAIAAINTNLVSAFDVGPTALTLSTTLGATHYGDFIQTSGSGLTHTLTDAATLGAGWHAHIRSTDTNNFTIGRATGSDTINGSATNLVVRGGDSGTIFVNAAANGFITSGFSSFFNKSNRHTTNIGLLSSVAAKALTVALKTQSLADPTANNPVEIAFRNATATTGDYVVRSATAATSVVVPSGATLGFIAAEMGIIYVYAIDNAGAVELAVSKNDTFNEILTYNTTAIGVTSDSHGVLYSTAARTGVSIRLIGRIDINTGIVAGEWDNEDTRISLISGKTKDVITEFSISSASTTDLGTSNSENILITGTTTINSFGIVDAGVIKKFRFSNILTLTYNATSMILPGLASILTAVNDCGEAMSLGSGNWFVTKFTRASGAAVVGRQLGTAIATTSGALHDFTGLPSGIREIILMLNGVSLDSSTVSLMVQIGDSGGIETTGYVAHSAAVTSTTFFPITDVTAQTRAYTGAVRLRLFSASTNTWILTGDIFSDAGTPLESKSFGIKSLSGTLDRIRLSNAGAVASFDAGSINILYE